MAKAKTTFWGDTFEQLAELGTSTVKKTTQSVAKTINPLTALETSETDKKAAHDKKMEAEKKKNNHTSVDFDKLERHYESEDEKKTKELRSRLFQLVKAGEEHVFESQKREKQQEEYQESQQKQEMHKKQQQAQAQNHAAPQGKIRKSILGGKKQKTAGMEQHAEYKPSSGKS